MDKKGRIYFYFVCCYVLILKCRGRNTHSNCPSTGSQFEVLPALYKKILKSIKIDKYH